MEEEVINSESFIYELWMCAILPQAVVTSGKSDVVLNLKQNMIPDLQNMYHRPAFHTEM